MIQRLFLSFLIAFISLNSFAGSRDWQMVSGTEVRTEGVQKLHPAKYDVYALNTGNFKSLLFSLPFDAAAAGEVVLPAPGGQFRTFMVWQTPVMEEGLASRYPGIKTFTAVAADNKQVTAKLDLTESGFHAYVFDGANTYVVDPYSNVNDGFYLCYYKRDYPRPANNRMECLAGDPHEDELGDQRISLTPTGLPGNTPLKINGVTKRTYRLAVACTIEYSIAVAGSNPTKSAVLSAIVTSINRVNGVYERELAVTMVLVANNDELIYVTGSDPYTNNNGPVMLGENQDNVDNVIGPFAYDIGHVFSTAGGGIADLGCICDFGTKAKGVTGQAKPLGDPFDIDYVAHEMGHQFGATHSFNANVNAGSCTGNAAKAAAYEPGSGSTLMAYAGICGNANNIQSHSDDYFHSNSLDQITNKISTTTCAVSTPANNTPPVVPPFAQGYYIPYLTPFELVAPDATDADHDSLNYCWEEWDLGDFGQSFANTNQFGPIFRSFRPVASTTRVFPDIDTLVDNVTAYTGEKLPTVARELRFRLTVRDMYNGLGSFNLPDDEINLHVINTGTPFKVNAPNTSSEYWQIGSAVTVQWEVANTTASPINCANVDIYLSTDNGYTYPYVLATGTPNDGSETITVPNAPTTSARVKVKGSGNVFFDLSNAGFTINTWPASVTDIGKDGLTIYPNPAKDNMHLELNSKSGYEAVIMNTLGQQVWRQNITGSTDIAVAGWAKGMYELHLMDNSTKERIIRKFIVE